MVRIPSLSRIVPLGVLPIEVMLEMGRPDYAYGKYLALAPAGCEESRGLSAAQKCA